VYHVQLRQFPNVARLFNLTREELDQRILLSWVAGRAVDVDDRRWSPDRARLTVIEGRRLGPEEIGIGRGWSNATRTGEDVSARLLEELARTSRLARPVVEELKQELLTRMMQGGLPVHMALPLAGERHPGWRVSDLLALAETAVWELLHQGRLHMVRGGVVVTPEEWEPALLAWATWTGAEPVSCLLEAVPDA
jgi:hypothetical protein